MNIFLRILSAIYILLLSPLLLLAQEENKINGSSPDVEMADLMRSNGKIYVVVAVIMMVLAGLIIYIIRLDRKIKKMEEH